MSTDRLPVIVTISATVAIDDRTKITPLVSVALPSTEGVDSIVAAGMQMLAAQIDAGEFSLTATVDHPEP